VFYRPDAARVAWCDPATGVIVTDAGRMLGAHPGAGRRRVNPADIADALAAAGVSRCYLTGGSWPASWLTFADPARSGWVPGKRGHYEDAADPRLDLARTGPAGPERVDLRRASSWGLPDDVTPRDARETFLALDSALRARFRGSPAGPILRATATATGQQLHALAAPAEWTGDQLDDDLAELVRSTSPQHRIETPGSCYGKCDQHRARPAVAPAVVTYLDARFTYASLTAGLGVAPAWRLTGDQATELLDRNPYARARFRARVTVPEWWEHPGLLMTRHPDGRHWHAPDLPGLTFETWVDSAELVPARAYGWRVELLEGLAFTEGARPLDVWTRRLVDVHKGATDTGTELGRNAARMVRAIMLRTIGAFHSTGRDVTHVADEPLDVPAAGVTYRRDLPDGRVVYRTRQAPRGAQAAHVRPELTAQIWGRAHARLWTAPGGAGFMSLDPGAVWGMWGDALYLSTGNPGWLDDGKPGRYRVKGTSPEPVARPAGAGELLTLRDTIGA
jgi:hypothetical protein